MDPRPCNLASSFSSSSTITRQQSSYFNFDNIPPLTLTTDCDPFSPQRQSQEHQLIRSMQQLNLAASFPAPKTTANSRRQSNDLFQYINPHSDKAPRVLQAHNRLAGRAEQSYKTVMCQNWLEQADCHFGSKCRFAHGPDDLRTSTVPLPINNKYKTRNCDKYTKNGICPYGQRCLFIHPDLDSLKQVTASPASSQQLRQQMPFEAIENKMHGTTTQSMPNRTLFAASLPMSLSQCHYQRSMAGRNLFPHIEEELRREKEEVQQQQQYSELRMDPALMRGSSSSSSSQAIEQAIERRAVDRDPDMNKMVDNLVQTPSAVSSKSTKTE